MLRRAKTRACFRAFRALDDWRRAERRFADLQILSTRMLARTKHSVLAFSLAAWRTVTRRSIETRWRLQVELRVRESRLSQVMLRGDRARLRHAFRAWVSFRTYTMRMKVGVAILDRCVSSRHRAVLNKSFHGWFGVLGVARCRREHAASLLQASAFETWARFMRSRQTFRHLFFAFKGKRETRLKACTLRTLSRCVMRQKERRRCLKRVIERTRRRVLARGLWRLDERARVSFLVGTAKRTRTIQRSFQSWKRFVIVRAWRKAALAQSILEAYRVRARKHL